MGDRKNWEKKLDAWYDRQSLDTLILIGLSPLILIAVVLIVVAVIWG